jgi:hypothetical protein
MNKKVITTCFAACSLVAGLSLISVSGVMAQDMGRPEMNLNGGSRGTVLFKHKLHQDVVDACAICHKDFEKKTGALDKAKKAGALRAKQVMNKTCLACHRAKRKAGEKSGPTSCSACHS